MLKAIFNWFVGKPAPHTEAPPVQAEVAPYKVEPAPVVKTQEPAPVTDHVRVEATAPQTKKPRVKKPVVAAKANKILPKKAAPKKSSKAQS
jgi:hypothetical protein